MNGHQIYGCTYWAEIAQCSPHGRKSDGRDARRNERYITHTGLLWSMNRIFMLLRDDASGFMSVIDYE